jgi:HK97 family phage prohead protease
MLFFARSLRRKTMSEEIYKVLDCEVKKISERSYEFTASNATQDRDGEVIDPLGWDLKNFKKNPVIMYAHDYRTLPIGRASRVWVSEGKELKNVVEFPPEGTYEFADIVERLVDTGYLKTESVGFIPKKWEDGDGEKSPRRTYTKQELLEISIVPVPSNPDALRNALNDGIITAKEFEACEGELCKNTKPEETDDFIRIPVRDCKVTATIDISKKEGIKALYCGDEKKVRTYMFDKRDPYNWTMAKAKKWIEEHDSEKEAPDGVTEIEIPRDLDITQEQISDELDYIVKLIESKGMNDEVREDFWRLVLEGMRLPGNDIPVDILEKVGAVLNQKNKDKLNQIKTLAQQVLDSAGEEEPKEIEPPRTVTEERVAQIVATAVQEAIAKAQGKV